MLQTYYFFVEGPSSAEQEHHFPCRTLNGSRGLSRSATELRTKPRAASGSDGTDGIGASSSPQHHGRRAETGVFQRLRQQHKHLGVAQRTQSFFATLRARWVGCSRMAKERKHRSNKEMHEIEHNLESDYAADYSSATEYSRSSSATHSPARHYLSHPVCSFEVFILLSDRLFPKDRMEEF
ncbi:hypothetical protein QAD02_014203 [Eretmocerus hayati]|uniref:Uncharacterized protein n=1 Tax=Eretmocerus hayati TaxID=131215 RepID=A0ACC2P6C4_9HYME|nr:hypothetical protein QAD02_014203 [Eretmocerus hayati]